MKCLKRIIVSVFVVVLGTFSSYGQGPTTQTSPTAYGFIENMGQVLDQDNKKNSSARYVLSLPGTSVVLRNTGFSYDTYIIDSTESDRPKLLHFGRDKKAKPTEYVRRYHRVDIEFAGANASPVITASEQSSDFLMYYNEETAGLKVYHYGKVVYKNVYPGIDVEFIARPGKNKPVEYNFIVHPGADVGSIRLAYKGAHKSGLVNGKVELTLAHGKLSENIPASFYQKSNRKASIHYKHLSSKQDEIVVGFEGNVQKPAETLVIDPTPVLDWGLDVSGAQEMKFNAVATDASGNTYAVGHTGNASGIATTGAHQTTLAGNNDVIVVKYNSTGTKLWGTYYGGTGEDEALTVAVDAAGYIYFGGFTYSTSGIATAGSHQATYPSSQAGFIAKFDGSGVRQWATYYCSYTAVYSIASDASNNIYAVGNTGASTGVATSGAYQTSTAGGISDTFIAKFNSSGVRQWGTYYGGTGTDYLRTVAVDGAGNVIVGGFGSNGFATAGAYQSGPSGAFISKFTSAGNRIWGTYINSITTWVYVDIDANNNIYAGGFPGYLYKFNPSGSFQWNSNYPGGELRGIDVIGNYAYWVETSGSGQVTRCVYQYQKGSQNDVIIRKVSISDGSVAWATYYGASQWDEPTGIAVDNIGKVHVVGIRSNANPAFNPTNTGFVAQFSEGILDPGTSPDLVLAKNWAYVGEPLNFTAPNHQTGDYYSFSADYNGQNMLVYS